MRSKVGGNVRKDDPHSRDSDVKAEEALFRKLPKSVRAALRDAPYNFNVEETWAMYKHNGAARTVFLIAQHSKRIMREEAIRLYGPRHPQA